MKDILDEISVIAAVNDEVVLERDLLSSPMLREAGVERHLYRGARTIGEAYEAGLHATRGEYMVFAHQDVYFPQGWHKRLAEAIATLDAAGTSWAVLGPIGARTEGGMAGRVWSSGSRREFSHPIKAPVPAMSLDELVLVVRRSSGLSFDPALPHFHLYGTDIVQSAWAAGHAAFVIDAPVVHNNDQLTGLGRGFRDAYRYMERKWADRLPIRTPVCMIEPGGASHRDAARRVVLRYWRQRLLRGGANRALEDPEAQALRLGYTPVGEPG